MFVPHSLGLGLVLAGALTACVSGSAAPPQLLVLAPLAAAGTPSAPAMLPPVVVGPIELPAYTTHTQVLVLADGGEMQALPGLRWAEPLEAMFSRVLIEDLSRLLGTARIATLGGAQTPATLQLRVEVTEFVTTNAGEALLTAYWQVLGDGGRSVLDQGKTTASQVLSGTAHAARVAALNDVLATLAGELADAVRRQPAHDTAPHPSAPLPRRS